MSRRKKRIPYSKEYLDALTNNSSKNEEAEEVFDTLFMIIKNGRCNALSLYEKRWFFHIAQGNYQVYKNNSKYGLELKSILEEFCLDDFKFMEVFRDYYNDLDGYKTSFKLRVDFTKTLQNYDSKSGEFELIVQEIPVSTLEKNADILYLNTKYEEWVVTMSKNSHKGDELLNSIINLTNEFNNEYIKKSGNGYNFIKAHSKKLLLRSKFMYLLGKQIFDESKSFEICIGQNKIEYNHESHCHVAVRHFSLNIGVNDKTHFYKDFDLRNIIEKLPEIFRMANGSGIFNELTIGKIDTPFFFEYNSQVYVLWVGEAEKSLEGKQVKYLQVKTFYPTEGKNDRDKYLSMSKINVGILSGKELVFFVK